MDYSSIVPTLIGVMVIVIVGGLGLMTSQKSGTLAEDRLAGLMGMRRARPPGSKTYQAESWPAPLRSTSGVLRSGPAWYPTPRT